MSGGGVSAPEIKFTPTTFDTGKGLFSIYTGGPQGGGQILLGERPAIRNSLNNLQNTFGQEASAFGSLANEVRPGFSQFRQAGLANIENARQSTISNLSDSLAQRRVLGSSFANASISNANADFAQKSADFIAASTLQEIDASQKLTQAEFAAQSQQYKTGLDQYNLESALAADLSKSTSSAFASIAEAQAQMQLQASEFNAQMKASEIAGLGSGIGSLLGGFGGKSDILLKEHIRQIGTTRYNLPLYHFNYRGSEDEYEGVMAHDVLKVMPDAVYRSFDGYHRINYPMLGIELRRL